MAGDSKVITAEWLLMHHATKKEIRLFYKLLPQGVSTRNDLLILASKGFPIVAYVKEMLNETDTELLMEKTTRTRRQYLEIVDSPGLTREEEADARIELQVEVANALADILGL